MTDQVRQDQRILNDLGLLLGGVQPQAQSQEDAFRALQQGQNPAPPPQVSPEILQLFGDRSGQPQPAPDQSMIQRALGSLFGGQ